MNAKSRCRQSAKMGRGESMEDGGNDKTLGIFKDGCARMVVEMGKRKTRVERDALVVVAVVAVVVRRWVTRSGVDCRWPVNRAAADADGDGGAGRRRQWQTTRH